MVYNTASLRPCVACLLPPWPIFPPTAYDCFANGAAPALTLLRCTILLFASHLPQPPPFLLRWACHPPLRFSARAHLPPCAVFHMSHYQRQHQATIAPKCLTRSPQQTQLPTFIASLPLLCVNAQFTAFLLEVGSLFIRCQPTSRLSSTITEPSP